MKPNFLSNTIKKINRNFFEKHTYLCTVTIDTITTVSNRQFL